MTKRPVDFDSGGFNPPSRIEPTSVTFTEALLVAILLVGLGYSLAILVGAI